MLRSVILGIASIPFIVTAKEIINIVFCQNRSPHKLSAGMEFNITAVKFVFDKLCVAHCRGNIGMPQNLLNIVDIRAVFQQVRRKRVA